MFNGAKILVTGATGSWGKVLVTQLLKTYDVKEIVCFSRNEFQQVAMKREFASSKLKFVIGDVKELDSVQSACRDVDYVFHLAALKHVPICEDQPVEVIKTNVDGVRNIITAAVQNSVKKVINVSSDKAVEPINVYGMTKALGEKLMIQANSLSDHTKFVCVRGGNVMGSSGSVIPFFIDQIKKNQTLTITDRRMTRFFLTLEEAIRLLLKASENSMGGETFVMNMPACYITDLAEVLMDTYGHVGTWETGIRPGEKLNEVLVSTNESTLTYEYDQNYYVILPPHSTGALLDKYSHLSKFPYSEFSSMTKLLKKDEIAQMLKAGNFI